MFLPEVTVTTFWQTENSRTVLHWAWKRPPVHRPVLPHGLDQVEDLFAVQTGAVLNTGERLVDLKMLYKGLGIGIYLYIYLYLHFGSTHRSPGLSCCLWPLETWLYPPVEHISAALHQSSGSQTCFQSLTFGDI